MENQSRYRRTCKKCGTIFKSFELYLNHAQNCQVSARKKKLFECNYCQKVFKRNYNLRRHLRSAHINDVGMSGAGTNGLARLFACGICKINFVSRDRMKQHRQSVHEKVVTEFRQVEEAHRRAVRVLRLDYPEDICDVTSALQYSHPHVCRELERERARSGYFKFNLVLTIEFVKINEENVPSQSTVAPFRSRMTRVIPMNSLDAELTAAYQLIHESATSYLERGSGWIIDEILHLDLELAACLDLAGKCYSSHTISWRGNDGFVLASDGFLPGGERTRCDELKKVFGDRAENKDCFYIALARHFNRNVTDRGKLLQYAADNFRGIKKSDKPVGVQDIAKFENQNEDLAINVVYLDEKNRILPVRVSPRVSAKHQVALLLIYADGEGQHINKAFDEDSNDDDGDDTLDESLFINREASQELMHYICIEEPHSFFAKRMNQAKRKEKKYAHYLCFNCFNGFQTEKALRNHVAWCHLNESQRIVYPKKENPVTFEAGYKACMAPFIIFYDFESLQLPAEKACSCDELTRAYTEADDATRMSMELDNYMMQSWEGIRPRKLRLCPHKTKVKSIQKGFAYHIIVVDRDGQVVESREYVGEDAGDKFCDDMLDLDELLMHQLEQIEPLKLTPVEEMMAKRATECWLCRKPLDEFRVRDHDHVTGKFLGAAHNICNLRRREQKKIVAFSHNFSG